MGDVPSLSPPDDPTLPLFVYGLLKPGGLAYPLVEPFVRAREPAIAPGKLWLRDGIPLLERSGEERVDGHLLRFDTAVLDKAWAVVSAFEPPAQYKWTVVDTQVGNQQIGANTLEGRRVREASAAETTQAWSAAHDPVFSEGLDAVRHLVLETVPGGVTNQPDTAELWEEFFRLQAAYLLLWSIVERYTMLRFGPGLDPNPRIRRLGEDILFCASVVAAGTEPGEVVDSRDPTTKYRVTADGAGAARYFYGVRSNLSHRGKSAFRDAMLVDKAVRELHDTMRILLARQLNRDTGQLLHRIAAIS